MLPSLSSREPKLSLDESELSPPAYSRPRQQGSQVPSLPWASALDPGDSSPGSLES